MSEIKVLDKGYVRLVDYMGNDLSVVRSARVSYDAHWRAGESEGSDFRLINYLARNKHTSPFESVELQFEVKLPIFVARQWMRHRTWSYNELSGRYKELPREFYVPEIESITTQSKDNKQMRTDEVVENADLLRELIDKQNDLSFSAYEVLLSEGCSRELARSVLPLGTYTLMFAKVNLMNLIKFIQLRDHEHAQYEIQEYAVAMKMLAENIAPVSVEAWGV